LWTLEAIGFEPRNFHASGAALLHQELGASYPRMEWFSNHHRLACATMFSLFFAGDLLAPGVEINGSPVQGYLQEHYIAAMRQVVRRLAPYPTIAGIDTLNEPGKGFIGIKDIAVAPKPYTLPGLAPSPWDAMRAGEGFPVEVDHVGLKGLGLGVLRRETMGSTGVRAWKDGEACVWRRSGVWEISRGEPVLRKPGHFAMSDFNESCLKPFIRRFAKEIRAEASDAGHYSSAAKSGAALKSQNDFPVFIEEPAHRESMPSFRKGEIPDIVNAAHWYDALDAALMNATLWNYSAGNEYAHGDVWNGEDLSVFSSDELKPPAEKAPAASLGGRALRGFVRPYAIATAGKPLKMSFNGRSGKFRYCFEADFSIQAPTEIFMPAIQYPEGYSIAVKGCRQIPPENAGSRLKSDRPAPAWPNSDSSVLYFVPNPGIALCEIVIERLK